jgi:hypothetical protein
LKPHIDCNDEKQRGLRLEEKGGDDDNQKTKQKEGEGRGREVSTRGESLGTNQVGVLGVGVKLEWPHSQLVH